jgi:hypothetical protein
MCSDAARVLTRTTISLSSSVFTLIVTMISSTEGTMSRRRSTLGRPFRMESVPIFVDLDLSGRYIPT